MSELRSPVPWIGGKHHSARYILAAFPTASAYDLYCEPFMGACHVIAQKPVDRHYEVLNGDLVNFWLQVRDKSEVLAKRLDSLPYSRQVHYDYHASLFDGTQFEPIERAVRWFYVLQSSFSSHLKTTSVGWKNGPRDKSRGQPHAFHAALELFPLISERFRYVEIDNRDFEKVICQHDSPRTLFYVDPPYMGVENYYKVGGLFSLADHERLASVLNGVLGCVALSYYDHPLLSQWYPNWRRITWETPKHSQRTRERHDIATEMLLCNYPAQATLFDELETGVGA